MLALLQRVMILMYGACMHATSIHFVITINYTGKCKGKAREGMCMYAIYYVIRHKQGKIGWAKLSWFSWFLRVL